MGKPRSDLDQHARNEKKLLIKNAIKKIQHAFLPNPEHAMCEYATQWSASAVSQYITYQYAIQWSAVSQCIRNGMDNADAAA